MSEGIGIRELALSGDCHPDFYPLREAFIENFHERGEIGARVTVLRGDEPVVDLWGGHVDEARTRAWDADTLVCTMSVSKGVIALAAHLLADRGLLAYDGPVARYWPEFAQAGKGAITVRQLLSHQASLVYSEAAAAGDVLDFERFADKLEASPPNWAPGERPSYHSVTYGFLIGTLITRIDGRPPGQFVQEELAQPLGAAYWLGCPESQLAHVVPTIFNPANELMTGGLINETTSPCFNALPEDPGFLNSPEHWRSVNPSSSGVAHANALARLFAPLANEGSFGGRQYYSPSTVEVLAEQQWHAKDSLFGNDFRVALGLLLNTDFNNFGREGNVGSAGAGGFVAFADPKHRLSFGYTPVRMTSGYGLGEEPGRLVEALYRCL